MGLSLCIGARQQQKSNIDGTTNALSDTLRQVGCWLFVHVSQEIVEELHLFEMAIGVDSRDIDFKWQVKKTKKRSLKNNKEFIRRLRKQKLFDVEEYAIEWTRRED